MGIRLSVRPIDLAGAERQLHGRRAGGVAFFAGTVRPDRRGDRTVVALVYEADRGPALARLREIERLARRKFRAIDVLLWHRVGRVRVGEVAVIVGAACAHRAEAFAAARYLIDELKATVPIWKEERSRPGPRASGPRSVPPRASRASP